MTIKDKEVGIDSQNKLGRTELNWLRQREM